MLKKIASIGSVLSKNEQKNILGGSFFEESQTIFCQCLNVPEEVGIRLSSCSDCKTYCNNGVFLCHSRF